MFGEKGEKEGEITFQGVRSLTKVLQIFEQRSKIFDVIPLFCGPVVIKKIEFTQIFGIVFCCGWEEGEGGFVR